MLKATFPPNILIEKFCQSAKRIIGVSSAAVVRDVFATTASFKRYTVLHNAFPVCTVFQANSMRTLALSPSRPLQNTSTHHAVSSWLAGSRKVRGTHQGLLQRSNLKTDFARSVLYRRSI